MYVKWTIKENMTLLSKSSKGSSSPPTYSKLSANGGLNEFNPTAATVSGGGGGVYSAMNGSSMGLTESIFNATANHHLHHHTSANNQTVGSNKLEHHLNSTSSRHHHGTTYSNRNNMTTNSSTIAHKTKKYHLIKSNDMISNTTPNIKDDKSKQEIAAKLVSEVYLTRLLATKVCFYKTTIYIWIKYDQKRFFQTLLVPKMLLKKKRFQI